MKRFRNSMIACQIHVCAVELHHFKMKEELILVKVKKVVNVYPS